MFLTKAHLIEFLIAVIQSICVSCQSPPEWKSTTPVIIKEDLGYGSLIATITAIGHNSVPVAIEPYDSFTSETVIVTTISGGRETKANIFLNNTDNIDTDRGHRSVDLIFVAFDSKVAKATVQPHTVTIYVTDVNDNAPRFSEPIYELEIDENTKPGYQLTTIKATDPDNGQGGKFTLTLQPFGQSLNLYNGTFMLNSSTNTINLVGHLDYETLSFYQYFIVAKDHDQQNPLTSSASLVITVRDVQDMPPVFQVPSFKTAVYENLPNGTKIEFGDISNIRAIDGDHGVPNHISYEIIQDSNCSNLFWIDKNSGALFTNTNNLDRDKPPIPRSGVCRLTINAMEVNTSGKHQYGVDSASTTVEIEIIDLDDNSPKFGQNDFHATVNENETNIELNIIGGSIAISDMDQVNIYNKMTIVVNWWNGSSFTGIKPEPTTIFKSGDIQLKLVNNFKFDFEKERSTSIKVIATEVNNRTKSATANVHIEIHDINDNAPVFTENNYKGNVAEEYGTNPNRPKEIKTILYVTATDLDTGIRGNITFSLGGEHEHFSIEKINGTTGEVKTKFIESRPLDRETKDQYAITVIAEDGEKKRSTAQLTIKVSDINDNKPMFMQEYSQISIDENKKDFGNFEFKAHDNDQKDSNNSKVQYKLHTPDYLRNNITIHMSTGRLGLNSPLDYEDLRSSNGAIRLTVEAYDLGNPSLSANTSVTINVQDINDHDPIFSSNVYIMSVVENSDEGTFVGSVSAVDSDGTSINNKVRYYIYSGVGSDKFRMNRENGRITVDKNARIDRETYKQYELTIIAYDTGIPQKNDTTLVNINIIDENDVRPTFSQEFYVANINESDPVNKEIIDCKASDIDMYPVLEYSIISASPDVYTGKSGNKSVEDLFYITNQGTIKLKTKIDREKISKVILTLNVTDVNGTANTPQTATVSLTITVEDSNDNDPVFSPIEEDKLNITEGLLGGIVFTLSATDKDLNSVLSYAITKDPSKAFYIDDPLKGTIRRRSNIDLDRESQATLLITVSVNDGLHEAQNNITFILQDINDNYPLFTNKTYTTNLTENNGTSTYSNKSVFILTASDKDFGVNAKLSYSIVSGNKGNVFKIHDKFKCDIVATGNIDREKVDPYILTIISTDSPTNTKDQKTGTATLTVIIDDVNDNSPIFRKTEYRKNILENSKVNQLVTTVTANDIDAGNNSLFTYKFSDNTTDFFSINSSTGDIYVKSNLTNQFGNYSIMVEAVDYGGLNSSTTVLIEVEDINNNPPAFVKFSPPVPSIYECARIGSLVLKLNSKDLDNGENSRVEYSFVGNSPYQSDFTIDGVNGEIRTVKELDAEKNSFYKLRVQVKDHGNPRLSSEQDLTIQVVDINDQPPEFRQKEFMTSVSENVDNKTIETVKAYDKDFSSEIIYEIVKNFNNSFAIDDKSGDVTIIKPIDREKLSTAVILQISAKDNTAYNISSQCDYQTNAFSNKTETNIIVKIIDQDDNPPIFTQPEIKKGLRRTVKLSTKILDLEKWIFPDPDTKEFQVHTYDFNGNMTYSTQALRDMILKTKLGGAEDCPDTQKTCICLTPNGTLITNLLFEENMKGSLKVPVIVWDGAGNSTATIKLDIISDDQTAAMLIKGSKNFVQVNQQEILNIASKITGKIFIADGIESKVTNGIAEADRTYLYFHVAETTNGPVLLASEAKELCDDYSTALGHSLVRFNLKTITEYKDTISKDDKPGITLKYVLMAVCALLAVTIVINGICFCSSVARYKRKLKAATTNTNVGTDGKETQPGTNLYARNKNPMFDKEVDSQAVDYDRFEDHVSVGSYDSYQFNKKDPIIEDEEKGATMDMYDDDYDTIEDETDGLAMVLAQHKKEKTASFENLVCSTSESSLQGVDTSSYDSLETTEV